MHIKKSDKNFETILNKLAKKYKGKAGGPETEVIVNWNKDEDKVAFYACNRELAKAIDRGREAIIELYIYEEGATLYFEADRVRPLYTVIRPSKSKTKSNLTNNHDNLDEDEPGPQLRVVS